MTKVTKMDATTSETVKAEEIMKPNKSGRFWKTEQTTRSSGIIKVKPLKSSWAKKMADKNKNKQVALLQKEIRDTQAQERADKKQRAKEQEERRLENERKAEIVQVIKNASKLRKTKKKHLRTIQKRDTTNMV